MVYQRIFQGVMLVFLASATFAACESSEPQTPQQKYCTAKCNCNKCTPTESATCLDDIVNLEDQARGADCKDPYETYLTCLNGDGACTDGNFDESSCFNEETDLKTCIKPPPVCPTVNDGKCNEPAPTGDGTCAAGTDAKDCMAPTCPTIEDGVCDEPEGTATCPDGSDVIDCPCTRCALYAQDQSAGTLCDTSASTFAALYQCACDTATCLTSCGDIDDICDGGMLTSTCLSCLNAFCTSQYNTCSMDF